ncbi:hypothetical protein NMD73_17110 (plasmid) [Edwardsiella tarda]|uniref:hypothetical protein n=1 Tax=Edwardsiella tarda TaxID=636 RepID=UPI00351BEF35
MWLSILFGRNNKCYALKIKFIIYFIKLVTPIKQMIVINGADIDSGALYQLGNATPAPLSKELEISIPKSVDKNVINFFINVCLPNKINY